MNIGIDMMGGDFAPLEAVKGIKLFFENQLSVDSCQLNHIDAWRMKDGEELENLGMRGMINDKSVLAIEWADRVAEAVRKRSEEAVVVWVKIEYGKRDNERVISWSAL